MKKILISIIIILLIGLGYIIGVKSLSIGQLKLESVGDIKNASASLDQKFNTSKEISAKTYPKSIEDLDKVVRDLKTAKQQYQAKTLNNPDVQSNLGIIQVEKYNIEYVIWAQDVAETGNRSYMKALNPLLKEGGVSDVGTDP